MTEKQMGFVMDIDHFAVHDGPGIRTCIFLKGCPLSCKWCHSPESQSIKPQILYAKSRCILCGSCIKACPHGLHKLDDTGHVFNRDTCTACGKCAKACRSDALVLSGRAMTVDQAVKEALSDEVFYKNSGGGITITGGEILLQATFARQVLEKVKMHDIHTIIETSGYGPKQDLLSFVEVTDVFYFDFKLGEPEQFKKYVGGSLEVVLNNLKALREKTNSIVLRIPLIPGITDTRENILAGYQLAQEMEIPTVHLMQYNSIADAKYDWIGKKYTLYGLEPREKLIEELLSLAPGGIKAEIMT
jgi:pyruvate formate lyase activating enzyme